MNLHNVSAVLVTRGDVDMQPVLDTLPFDDVVIWDNKQRGIDLKVYGRYAAMPEVRNPVVYVQDDDCTLTLEAIETLVAEYRRGEIIANMPVSRWDDYPDSCLVGWGAVFDHWLPRDTFDRYLRSKYDLGFRDFDQFGVVSPRFLRDCDVVFTTLTPHIKLDLGFEHLPWAETPGRMFKQPEHAPSRAQMLDECRAIRDRVMA